MHDGEDHDFIDGRNIKNAEGKPFQETPSDLLLHSWSGFRMGGDDWVW
jgi:hypothetical protein